MRDVLNDESDEEYTEQERQSLAKTFAMAKVTSNVHFYLEALRVGL